MKKVLSNPYIMQSAILVVGVIAFFVAHLFASNNVRDSVTITSIVIAITSVVVIIVIVFIVDAFATEATAVTFAIVALPIAATAITFSTAVTHTLFDNSFVICLIAITAGIMMKNDESVKTLKISLKRYIFIGRAVALSIIPAVAYTLTRMVLSN